jgi:gliding motility-associated-like protein
MLMNRKIIIICFGLIVGLLGINSANAQCNIVVDTANITQVTCPGGVDGFASLSQTPYTTYSWDNITNGLNYGIGAMLTSTNTLAAGLYIVTGTTPLSGFCPPTMSSDTFEILEPIVDNSLNPPLACDPSNCNVTSTINITKQFPGYTYGISVNGGASQTIPAVTSNLCAGSQSYTINYNDGVSTANCPTETFNIAAGNLTASINLVDTINCFGDYATIQVVTLGGAGWYSYLLEYEIFGNWYQLSTQTTYDTATFTTLPANNYRTTVTDTFGGCTAQAFINVTQPPNLMPTFSIANPSLCFGDSVADLNLNVFGGIPPYTVTLNGGPITPITGNSINFLNVPAGTYQVIITDANGCTKTRNKTITSPPVLVPNSIILSNYNGYDISCFGGSDGAVLAQVNFGGTSPFQFSINGGNFFSNPFFQGLSSGQHIIAYRDTNGCETSDTLTLQDPPDLSGTVSVSSAISCHSICDGQITFTVDPNLPGTPIYQYSLDGGAYQTGNIFGGLCGNINYAITVRDNNGCTYTDSIYLTQPDSLDLYVSVLSNYNGWGVSCNGATDGTISVDSVNGGTPLYTYSIDGGPFGSSTFFANLAGGPHTIMVQDASACRQTANITISEPNPYSIALTTNVSYNGFDVACNGDCNGSIHVTSTGGVPSYLYSLNGGASQASSNFNGQCANTLLTVNATDANGCAAQDSILLIEPSVLTLQMDSVMENCGAGDGQAIALAGGGVTPYFYLWTDGQTTSTAINLSTGTYTVTVTDTNGCSITNNVFVPGTDMILSSSSTDVLCNGGSDGTATVSVTGSYAPTLTYQWNDPNFQITATATGLAAGTYIVTVTDGNGCSINDTINVAEPTVVNLELDSANSLFMVSCFGDSLGVASLSATGGIGPGTYWFYIDAANPQNDSNFYGLPAGNYLIFVNDANGCTDSIEVQISEPAEITFILSSTDVLCNGGSSGSAEVASISGGTPAYSYAWSNGASTDSIGGLVIGTYWITVTDTNGCTIYPPDTVTIGEPTQLTTSVSSTSSMCAGTVANGTAGVVASGGTMPYSYLWSTGATTANISLLVAGTYIVIVTDDNGCVAYDTIVVQQGPQPILSVVVQNVSCFGANDGMITPSATGGTTPYQFSINGGNTWQNAGVQYGPSGQASYFVTVRDSNGCVESDSVFVLEPALLVIDSFSINEVSCYGGSDGEITVHHSGGTQGFSYNWSNLQTTQTVIGLSIGTFSVIVTDTNGCTDTSVSVIMTQPDSLYIPSITSTDVLCNGGNDGTATVTAQGGVLPYSYLWSNGDMTQTANMSAGNYSVDVTDFNGCVVSASIIVNEPAALVTDSFVMDSVFCFGFSDGSAMIYISGGVTPYTYLWDNGENTVLADSLDAGYHIVTITDFNNCLHTDSVEVLEPAASVSIDSLIVAQISCKDASNGSIVILATGGIPSYTYSKDGGNTYQTAIGFIGLSPATYTVVVKDNKGCTASVMQTITEPDSLLIASVGYHDVSCNGYNNGYIQSITVSGGTQPYMYSVNGSVPVSHLANFNGYGPGTYTVEVFDAHNCVVADIITINEPQPLNTTITTSNYNGYEIRCNGDSTGWISVNINGGVTPYLKTWINAQGDTVQSTYSVSVDSLNAGLYTLIVLDANACMKTQFITLNEPTPLQHNIVTTHVTCDGWTNGSITDSVFGGVPGYSYLWNTGDTTYVIDNLPIGPYSIIATDENNCQSSTSTIVNDNNKLAATISNIQDVSCFGYCDGFIEVTITGGMPFFNSTGNPIYTNIWNDPLSQITATSIGLCADENTLTTIYIDSITDAIGCQVVVNGTISQPSEVEITASVLDGISCYSGNDGKLKAVATGGTPAGSSYTYNWNTGFQQTGVFSTLSNTGTGSYVIIATDANGCMDTTEIFLSEPSVLSVSVSSTNVSCFGDDDGTITAIPAGGTPIPPSGIYTYSWSDGQTTQTATGLAPGIYEVTITDDNGCMVTSSNVLMTQPLSELIVTADSTDETCVMNDGTAMANVFGGTTPYGYSWNTGQTSQTIAGLSPGSYTVDVTDGNGCVLSESTYVNAFDAIFLPSFTDYFSDTICLGDNVTISVLDNPNFIYSWNSGHLTPSITVSPEDPRTDYILTVVDLNNCPFSSFDITATIWVTHLPIIPIATPNPIKAKDQVELRAASANNYNQYIWTDELGEEISNSKTTFVYPEESTTYYIWVEDGGCEGFDSVRVIVGVMVYDGISPNGDGYNDFWEIEDIDRYPDADIEVYNRWGSLLFSAKGDVYNDKKWDGTHNGELLPIGTYYYIINLNNDSEMQSGAITIIR